MARTRATSRKRVIFSGYVDPSAADGQFGFPIPFSAAHIVNFGYALDNGGSGSGPTAVQLNRVRDETDAELLSATLDIAHDATTVSNDVGAGGFTADNVLQKGDIVRGDVDGLSTSAAGLAWWAEVHIDQE